MQIDSLSHFRGAVNVDALDKAEKNSTPVALSLEMLSLDQLPSEGMPEVQSRNALRHALEGSSPELRNEVITELKQFSRTVPGSEIGKQIDEKLPEIEKKSSGQGLSVDRLLELLFSLLQLMAKANTERSNNAAKMGEISVHQAKVSGNNTIVAANSNLGGAIMGLGVGVAVGGVGYSKYSSGVKKHISNLDGNHPKIKTGTDTKNDGSAKIHHSRRDSPVVTDGATGRPTAQTNHGHAVDGEHFAAQPGKPNNPIQDKSGQNSLSHSQEQFAGQAISGFSPFVSNVAQSGFGIHGAAKTAEAKVNDAEHDIASNMQHNEDQLAQRLTDLMAKLLSLITSAAEEANRNIAERSQAIKA